MNTAKNIQKNNQESRQNPKSDIAPRPLVKTGPGKGKRSVDDMLAECDTPILEAYYAMTRIDSYEHGIRNILDKVSLKAKVIILERRPSLKRYA